MIHPSASPMEARLLKGIGGLYTAVSDDGTRHECRARGIFRHRGIKPLAGDRVLLIQEENGLLALNDILPRKNALIRPPLANLDLLFIVIAAAKPDPELFLVDKLIAYAELNQIEPILLVTKKDLNPERAEEIGSLYAGCGFRTFVTTVPPTGKTEGIEALRDGLHSLCAGKIAAFSGVSGAGKSTLLNTVFPNLLLETGSLSARIERGKNTTRSVELFEIACADGVSGFLADTPGFSFLDLENLADCTRDQLPMLFREFRPFVGQCRYTKCTHTKEDGCAILDAVERGEIPRERHNSFLQLFTDWKITAEWQKKDKSE